MFVSRHSRTAGLNNLWARLAMSLVAALFLGAACSTFNVSDRITVSQPVKIHRTAISKECDNTEMEHAFEHISQFGELINGPETVGKLSSILNEPLSPESFKARFHLRQRIDPDSLYFEIEANDMSKARNDLSAWLAVAQDVLTNHQANYLETIDDSRLKVCAESAMLKLEISDDIDFRTATGETKPLLLGLTSSAIALMLWLPTLSARGSKRHRDPREAKR